MVYFINPFFPYNNTLNLLGKSLTGGSKGMGKVDGVGSCWVLDALFFVTIFLKEYKIYVNWYD